MLYIYTHTDIYFEQDHSKQGFLCVCLAVLKFTEIHLPWSLSARIKGVGHYCPAINCIFKKKLFLCMTPVLVANFGTSMFIFRNRTYQLMKLGKYDRNVKAAYPPLPCHT